MATSFNTTVASLEDELMSLILDGKIQARIDSHNKVTNNGGLFTLPLYIYNFYQSMYWLN